MFFSVNFILQKFRPCKKNDKYQVWYGLTRGSTKGPRGPKNKRESETIIRRGESEKHSHWVIAPNGHLLILSQFLRVKKLSQESEISYSGWGVVAPTYIHSLLSAYIHVADETLPLFHCSHCTDNDQVLAGTDSVPPLRPITTLPASSGSSFFSESSSFRGLHFVALCFGAALSLPQLIL